MVTSNPASPSTSRTASVIIRRGTGLIAGPPTVRPRPALVTVPTPTPARKTTSSAGRTVTVRWAPWVTSGSSPASLTTTAVAASSHRSAESTSKVCRLPEGKPISTVAGVVPSRSSSAAALAAAAEHAPVVNPVRKAFCRTFMVRGRSGSRRYRNII